MLVNTTHLNNINSPVRKIAARAELYSGSTLAATYNHNNFIKSIEVERVGDNTKFFGYGICQRLNIKLIDINREKEITTANNFKIAFGLNDSYISSLPVFFVSEVNRDENTNELSITAYDGIYKASNHTIAEIDIEPPYTISDITRKIALYLGFNDLTYTDTPFDVSYAEGANLSGTETLREVLDAIAEATQTIYFANAGGFLVFKRLDIGGEPVLNINKNNYFSLDSKTNRRLTNLTHTTELGDNTTAALNESGTTQFIRDNAFLNLREDIAELMQAALDRVGGLTINQFNCSWRGNYLAELGDKIALTTKDNNTVIAYLLDDVINYDGGYSHNTQWSYQDNDSEKAETASTIGEAIKQTFAKVDKVNKEITLVASEAEANKESIAALEINTGSISASVESVEKTLQEGLDAVNEEINNVSNRVDLAISAEDVDIKIKNELDNGVSKVITETGFTFDNSGLTVSKSDSDISTTITEDGMTVSRGDEIVLTANNEGVEAEDLKATTYLIIGNNSRFEDYLDSRTGCFFIG